jgi:prepilin signal peptidase PulO-like enzyme (type II secretory pathway)
MEYFFQLILAFIFGSCFGSFISAASYRLVRDEDIVFKKSYCPNCKHSLSWRDLAPIFSWLFSHGKCRYCKKNISIRYPLIEIATGAAFMLIFYFLGVSEATIIFYPLAVVLIAIIVTDLEHYIIPDSLQIATLLLAIWWGYLHHYTLYDYTMPAIYALAGGFALKYAFQYVRKKDGLGIGDIKFFASAALFLGLKGFIPFLLFSGILGIVFGLLWQYWRKTALFPFAPSLVISLFFCLIIPQIVDSFWELNFTLFSLIGLSII